MNKRIKALITAFAVAAVSIFGSVPAYAAASDGISVSGGPTLSPGDTITISVKCPSVTEKVQGANFNAVFDTSVFEVTTYRPSSSKLSSWNGIVDDNDEDVEVSFLANTKTDANEKGTISAHVFTTGNYITINEWVLTAELKVKETAPAGNTEITIDPKTFAVAKHVASVEENIAPTDYTSSVPLTIQGKTVAVTSVSLDKTKLSLDTGKTGTLTATVLPDDATDKTVTWTSSNEKVATVANGVVTAKQEGTATITAAAGGKSAACTVTVKCGHENTTDYPAVASTCEVKGHAAYTKCNDCGKIITGSDAELPLADHTLGTPATCKDKAVCSVCGKSYGETTGHNYGTLKPMVNASCTEDGMNAYYQCSDCSKVFTDGKVETTSEKLVIKALGHTGGKADCHDKAVCTRCNQPYGELDPTNHKSIEVTKEAKEATCTAEGNTEEQKCTACSTVIKASEVIEMIPHAGGKADCKDKAICSSCGQPYGELDPTNHKSIEITKEAKEATCTAEGNTAEEKCTACGTVITASEVIEKIPHKTGEWVNDESNHWKECSVCGTKVDAAAHELLWVADKVEEGADPTMHEECEVCNYTGKANTPVPSSDCEHNMVKTEAKAPTCTVKGNKEYYTCSGDCKKVFRDATGLNEVADVSSLDIPVIDHDYSVVKYDQTSHWKVCSMCGAKSDETVAEHTLGADNKCECGYKKTVVNPGSTGSEKPTFPADTTGSTGTSGSSSSSSASGSGSGDKDKPANSDEPQIMGENGKKGWAAIKSDINDTKSGGKVTVDMNGATTLPKNVVSSIKGKDIELVIVLDNGIKWTINGKDVSSAKDIDLDVKVYTDNIPDSVVDNVADGRKTVQMSLAHNGKFGFKAAVSIDLGESNSGKYANLFCFDEENDELKYETSVKISKKGIAKLPLSHASEWVIIIDDVRFKGGDVSAASDDNDVPEYDDDDDTLVIPDDNVTVVVGAGDDSNPVTGVVLPISIAILSLAGGTAAFTAKKRNKK